MKTFTTLAVALVFLTTTVRATVSDDAIFIGHSKNKNLFAFKTQKHFVGAMVEVYTSQGSLLTYQNLHKRRMIIDFRSAMKDTYTILVVKGNATREFKYIKK